MKKTVILGLLISGIGGVMPLFYATNYTYLLISRFMFGVGKGLIFTPSVSYITLLFKPEERPNLIGYRSAMEMFGQSLLTFLMGILVVFGWHISYIVNFVFFIIAALVLYKIPELNEANEEKSQSNSPIKIPPVVIPLALFVGLVAITSSMIAIRFPALATQIRGEGYNASIWVAIKPLLGILAASFFGKMNKLIGKKVLYLGTMMLIISQLMIGFSGNSFFMLTTGFLLSAFVLGWIIPVIINTISRITTGKQQRLSAACTLLCAHIGIFFMPFIVTFIETILGTTELAAPYPLSAAIITIALICIIISGNSKSIRKKVGL